jgi:hypothetical protein
MRQTTIPAQITTVEDRIVGNLSLTQVMLLAVPMLSTGLVFVALPPTMQLTPSKFFGLVMLAVFCSGLAIRIKGKLLLSWLILRVRYNLRPRHYVFNKNTTTNRNLRILSNELAQLDARPTRPNVRRRALRLTSAEAARTIEAMENPAANLAFTTTKKGNLYVRITEVK